MAEALEAQSNTINELMAVRETLTTKLRTAQATARKLEIERSSVLEMLQELPSESIRFDTVRTHTPLPHPALLSRPLPSRRVG